MGVLDEEGSFMASFQKWKLLVWCYEPGLWFSHGYL